jgi:hypothetical protein
VAVVLAGVSNFTQEIAMKLAMILLTAIGLCAYFMPLSGCATDEPGASDTLGTYSTNIDSSPDKVTDAANKACSDLKLTNIVSTGTKVDGKVTAKTAAGDDVTIDITQSGDGVSKMSIRVGATGDQSISKQLVDKTKSHLSWL